jgi:hypothetical protein
MQTNPNPPTCKSKGNRHLSPTSCMTALNARPGKGIKRKKEKGQGQKAKW